MVRDVVVAIAKDASHENGRDTSAVVSLRCKVDDGDDGADQDVKTCAPNTCRSANVYRESYEIFYSATTVEHHQDGQDGRADDGSNHSMPPSETDGYQGSTEVVATWAESHSEVVCKVVFPFPSSIR